MVLADPQSRVSEMMNDDLITVSPLTDAEMAAQTLIDHNLMAVPVVDGDKRLLGIITEDEALDITREEATEDAERQGGSTPLEVPYLRASPWLLWRKRIVWLLALFAAEAYTGTVLRAFDKELEAVVALAFFIPLLIGTGGNTGTQITTTLVRWTLNAGPQVVLTVSVSVAAIVLWSSLVAAILPPLTKRFRLDPAIVSAPLIATIVDGTGLMIYFTIARLTVPQLQGLG